MTQFNGHTERDLVLPINRKKMMDNIEKDSNVLAIFYGGSLGNNNTDIYSDIDLRIVIDQSMIQEYRDDKKQRAQKWGNVLFYEDTNIIASLLLIMIHLLKQIYSIMKRKI